MIYGKPKGVCVICQRLIKLRKDGTVGYHGSKDPKIWPPIPCGGWTKNPLRGFA